MNRRAETSPLARLTATFYALRRPAFSILFALLMASSVWMYFQRVMIPHQQNEAVRDDKPRGNLSDLYPRWLGARELLLHRRDPYSAEITREIQAGYYGRVLDPDRPHDPKDQQAFAYPLFVVWLLAPMVGLPFWIAQRLTLIVLVALTVLSVFVWLETLDWSLPFHGKIAWALLTVSCLPAVQGLKLQQLTLLVAALIAFAVIAISRNRLMAAGILLAFATIKPQLLFLLIIWLGIWISADWRSRRKLLWSFGFTMTLLVGASQVLLPGWIREFNQAMNSYYRYTGGGQSLLDVVLTPVWGHLCAFIIVVFFLVLVWRLRSYPASSPQFQFAVSFTLATTLLVIPMFAPYNQILLLPAAMMLIRATMHRPNIGFLSRFFVFVMKLSVAWPFLTAALLLMALPLIPSQVVDKGVGLPFYSTLSLPISVFATLLILKNQLISREVGDRDASCPTLQASAASE